MSNVFGGQIPSINPDANYWFFRTSGGYLYENFKEHGLVSIGYPEFKLSELSILNKYESDQYPDQLKKMASAKYPSSERPGLVASQLYRFYSLMKKDDYVIIPNHGSENLLIGQIRSDSVESQNLFVKGKLVDGFNKIKRVKWLKETSRYHVNPNLLGLFSTHQTVSAANDYQDWIDEIIYDIYEKGGLYFFSLNVRKSKNFNAKHLFKGIYELLELTDIVCKNIGISENTDNVEAKINLNSPGKIKLIGKVALAMIVAGSIIIAFNGGHFNVEVKSLGINASIGSDGLIEKINRFLNSSADRELKGRVGKIISEMQIARPEQIEQILKEINSNNQNK